MLLICKKIYQAIYIASLLLNNLKNYNILDHCRVANDRYNSRYIVSQTRKEGKEKKKGRKTVFVVVLNKSIGYHRIFELSL